MRPRYTNNRRCSPLLQCSEQRVQHITKAVNVKTLTSLRSGRVAPAAPGHMETRKLLAREAACCGTAGVWCYCGNRVP